MTRSARDEPWPVWLLGTLTALAVGLIATGIFLWVRQPPTGPIARQPTATVTAQPTQVARRTATPAPIVRRTLGAVPTPSPGVESAPPVAEPVVTVTKEVEATKSLTVPPITTEAAPIVTGNRGTVEGRVTLQGRERYAGITLLVNGTPAGSTDELGVFQLILPPGHYTVRASYPAYIAIEAPDVEVRAGEVVSLPQGLLHAGDTDRDSDIDLFDVVRCAIDFGKAVPEADSHADVNGDGVIDLRDVTLAQQNYREIGPAPWR